MSGEAFTTIACVDMRTAPDGVGIECAPSHSQEPRAWAGGRRTDAAQGWASCHLYAQGALELAAHAIETQPMAGLTGDHSEKRAQLAAIIGACAFAALELALDHACDGALDDKENDWSYAIAYIRRLSEFPWQGIPSDIATIIERTRRLRVVAEP